MFLQSGRTLMAWALIAFLASPAFADIKTYNAAVQRGDLAAAAVEAEGVWQTLDKTRPDAVVIAREFAYTAMRANRPASALAYARWLVTDAPAAGLRDDDAILSKVLLQWAEMVAAPSAAGRASLSESLSAWAVANPRSVTPLAVSASAALYDAGWQARAWKDVRRDAPIAANLAGRLGAGGLAIQTRASLAAAAARFLDERGIEAYMEVADANDVLMERMGSPKPGEKVEELDALDMQAHAWLDTMEGYFQQRKGNAAEKQVKDRRLALKYRCPGGPCPEIVKEGELRKCPVEWDQKPKLAYPGDAAFRGLVGSVVLEMTTDAAGVVTDAKVIAAVPTDTFSEPTIKTVRKWKARRLEIATEPCTLAGTRRLYTAFGMSS